MRLFWHEYCSLKSRIDFSVFKHMLFQYYQHRPGEVAVSCACYVILTEKEQKKI